MTNSDNITRELIELVKNGHKPSFGKLVTRHYGTLMYYLIGFGLSASDAEDITQEAFIRAFTRFDQFKPSGTFIGWILRIARNLVIDKHRKEKNKETPVDFTSFNDFTNGHTPEKEAISNAGVDDIFSDLKPRERVILELRVFQKLSFNEIAEIMGSTDGNLRLLFHRLISKLRKQLKEKVGLNDNA